MGKDGASNSEDESLPLTYDTPPFFNRRASEDSLSSDDSLYVDEINGITSTSRPILKDPRGNRQYLDSENVGSEVGDTILHIASRKAKGRTRLVIWIVSIICIGIWLTSFFFLLRQHGVDDAATESTIAVHETSYSQRLTLDQVLDGAWSPKKHSISWIAGPNGEDGLLLEQDQRSEKGYLRVEDIRDRKDGTKHKNTRVLMESSTIFSDNHPIIPARVWPSPDFTNVLVMSDEEKNWRHSFTGRYWLFNVKSQKAEPLLPDDPGARIQLASWSPRSDAIAFTRGNNMYLRKLSSKKVIAITRDGGKDLFYGIPDWVYEEEVFAGNSVTWWSRDGRYISFLRTNESMVPEYPVQYFMSRPSGKRPPPGFENYPEVRQIKYPKSGSPNPLVDLQVYDIEKNDVFTVDLSQGFADENRIIIDVIWASKGQVLVRETNRESDVLKVILVDMNTRSGEVVRSHDIASLDGGWIEPSQSTRYIPADPNNGRPYDGYIDTVIHGGYSHLAYFAPLNNSAARFLTSGEWEVVDAPSAVDLKKGLVYFVGTQNSPTQRHVYSVKLDGTDLNSVTDTSKAGFYGASFSQAAGYTLLSYYGPSIPWQKVVSTPSSEDVYDELIEDNPKLSEMVDTYALPVEIYQTVTIDGFSLQVVERRPPHFNPARRYPVLFYVYGGPGSQEVDRKFNVDFQSYVASGLGYIVVTVDGRGTGYSGREFRCIVRGNLGYYEAHDQIETAKLWAKKDYVDETRMAIWGWSYGGFMALKTLEQDAGQTFRYGMAVAPVTDWRYYDSIYTERYMRMPQHNPAGYDHTSISNMTALRQSVRFLFMHGVADDNVHMQNSLKLIDDLDLANVENYDVHVFPDSDHSIVFHNGHRIVYERLSNWIVNAFNGEWHRISNPEPSSAPWRFLKRIAAPFR